MVEWKKIKDVCSNICSGGTPNTKNRDYYYGDIPWLRTQEVDWGNIYDTEIKISQKGLDNSSAKIIEKDCVIVAMYGATAAKVAINKIPLSTNQACCNLKINKDISCYRYVYYWLCKEYHKLKALGEGSQNNISGLKIKDYPIPIPSLSEQNRIVGILDTFTDSIENLKQQIAQRRKQYEHYRDKLLDLEGKEGVEMKACSDVCEVTDYVANGSFATLRENVNYKTEPDYAILVRTIDLSNKFNGDKIYIDERAYNFLSKSSLFGGEIIINNIGAGVGQTFRCPNLKERMSLGPNSILVKTPNNDFFYYWFNSIYGQNAIMKVVSPGAMPKFNKTGFKTISLPVPSLQEQQRIVSILDTFEASISNLEAQLEQRQKQYEYYRNKLLSFEKEEQ